MADREKVIKALECLYENKPVKDCENCSYGMKIGPHWGCDFASIFGNAIALLKAREPCEDAVSKQAVISALEGEYSDWNNDYNIPITHCIKAVQSIPSVQAVPVARVMNVTEVSACEVGTVLWVEERQGVTWNLFPLEIETSSTHPDTGTDYLFFITYHDIRKFECSEYNQTWRCWTQHPTNEQREATPWE